ncbi:MAG: rRNA maturation RNase YbeY [Gemmatimonadaceae bacterium]
MTRLVHVAAEGVRLPVSLARVERTALAVLRAERVRDAELSVTFVSDRRMASLNWEHLRHRGPTDVISFEFAPVGATGIAGDIYVAPAVARRNALAHGAPIREEMLRLVIHGVLHVLGHDHPVDDERYASAMWRRQERLLRSAMAAS